MANNISPLFDRLEKGSFQQLRVRYAEPVTPPADQPKLSPFDIAKFYPGDASKPIVMTAVAAQNRLKIEVVPVTEDQAHPVASVAAAEDEIMALAEGNQVFDIPKGGEGSCVGDHYVALAIMINRSANIIAARTRRGAGNVVLLSPKGLDILESASVSAFARASSSVDEIEEYGRWKAVGCINSSMRVFVSDEMESDTVIVTYVGGTGSKTNDGPAALFETDDGLALYILDDSPEALGNAKDYLQRITLRNE